MQPATNTIVSLISVCLCVLPCGSGGVWVYFPRDKVPSGASCGHHMPVVPPKPAVGPGNDCESGKRSNKPPCKTTTKSTLPSASSKLEKHFTPPIVRGQRVPTACLILSLCGGDRHPSMALFASASPHSTESIGASSTRTAGGANFTHPRVGQAERLACRKRPPNAFLRAEAHAHFICGKKKMLRCITHQGGESHCIASVRPRVRRSGCRAAVYPTNQNTAAMRPLWVTSEDKSRRPESLICSIRVPKLNSLKNIVSSLYPAVSPGPGTFDFRTRIKGGGRKAPVSRSQRPAERGVSKDSGILPQRRLRWSLKGLFGFQVVGGLRKSRGPRRLPVFSPTLCTATAGQRRNRRNDPAQSWRPKSAGQRTGKENRHGAQGGRS